MTHSSKFPPVLAAACAIGLALAARPARADCGGGAPAGYGVKANANTVTACVPRKPYADASNPMLRQDEATGDVVVVEGTSDSGGCLQDQCVPAGTYRYGLATPPACSPSDTCGSDLPMFGEVTVSSPLPASCTGGATMPTTMVPPWGGAGGNSATVSFYQICPGKGCGCATVGERRGAVLAVDLLVAAAGLLAVRLGARRRRGSPASATPSPPGCRGATTRTSDP